MEKCSLPTDYSGERYTTPGTPLGSRVSRCEPAQSSQSPHDQHAHFTDKKIEACGNDGACESPHKLVGAWASILTFCLVLSPRLRCIKAKNQESWARKPVGIHLKGTPRNLYLDHQKHESAHGPRRRQCHRSLRHWRGRNGGESDAMCRGLTTSSVWRHGSWAPEPVRAWRAGCVSLCPLDS